MSFHICRGLFWVRLGFSGRGVVVKDTRRHPLTFSQRNGYKRGIQLGWLWLELLEAQ